MTKKILLVGVGVKRQEWTGGAGQTLTLAPL
jgi:hypothetical protein